ncbi:pilus assembly protein TadG-related protein [Sulfitobacter sp. LCG007]
MRNASTLRAQVDLGSSLRRQLSHFVRRDDGAMTLLACFIILMMVLVCGIGVDLMHNEMDRTRLQNTMDRAVLAAADLDQTLDPKSVVEDYFQKAGMRDYLTNVEVSAGLGYREVNASARMVTRTQFMHRLGTPELPVPASSEATERVPNVEISLVLDISGSMKNNDKIENLREAAQIFVNTVIRPETEGQVSLSIVPYSEHVNVGEEIFDSLNVNQKHDYSYCLEVPDSFYGTTAVNTSYIYEQMQFFQFNYYSNESGYQANTTYDTVCPRYWYEQIRPISENASEINTQIQNLKPRAGTSIFMGMKWAVSLLDPSFREVTADLVSSGAVEAEFSNRPVDYGDEETLKTVVLMTDGQNDKTHRINAQYYDIDTDERFWSLDEDLYADQSEAAYWHVNNFQYYLNRYVSSYKRSSYYYQKYSAAQGDLLLDTICDAAKEKGIVIWAVGFETTDHGAEQMRNCASSESHFFRVEGTEIQSAFQTIARQINQLRLTL